MIRIDSATVHFGDTPALRELSLQVPDRTIALVTGHAGSGKSTLIDVCRAVVKPDSGTVAVDEPIAVVTQSYLLPSSLTALEQLVLQGLIRGVPASEAETTGQELLVALGLDGVDRNMPDELSGGQRQRLAVARRWPRDRRPCCSTNPRVPWTAPVAAWCCGPSGWLPTPEPRC
ncbi:ATP-binding cassette domain-containing protein [Branchiibius cervicis]|uniref:ATP-binding cassette domain-containing protein n=1 Tax=Branchiibius cervicis TaxID=908252 RepID=A0ABW2AXI2_9MICO